MKSSKDFVFQKALSLIKQHKKRFYRNIWANWAQRAITSNPEVEYFRQGKYRDNPELCAELLMIRTALFRLGFGVDYPSNEVLEKVHKKYMPRFIKYYLQPMVLRNGGIFPHMGKTAAIKELLARGWIHVDEFMYDPEHVYIKCNIAPLVWPDTYYHHQDAIAQNDKVGIPGYTGTVLPKNKKQ